MSQVMYANFLDWGWWKIDYDGDTVVAISPWQGSKPPINRSETTLFIEEVMGQLKDYFQGKRQIFDFKIRTQGTPFQRLVWEALCTVPYGSTISYKELAEKIGHPKSARAVGNANRKNPLLIRVPCHRVIGASGRISGYAGGSLLKQKLLDLEKRIKKPV